MFKGIFSIFFIFPILWFALSCSTYPPFKSVENYWCMASFKVYNQSKGITHHYESCEGQLIRGEDKYIYDFKVARISEKRKLINYTNLKLEINYKNKPDYTLYPALGRFPSRVKYAELFIEDKKFNLTWENSWITQRDDNIFGREIMIVIEKDIHSANDPVLILKSGPPTLLSGGNTDYEKIKQNRAENYGK